MITVNSHIIEAALKQRGFVYRSDSPTDSVLLPRPISRESLDQYYQQLKRYSFRLFLRDVIKYSTNFTRSDLLHYCSPRKTENYLNLLVEMGMVTSNQEGCYTLVADNIKNFGDTLEFYIAQVMGREFLAPAAWRVQLQDVTVGGDFDLITLLSGQLVLMEIKSSPPKNVHQKVVNEFLKRCQLLHPDLAIFFIDTHLRLTDKINKMVKWGLEQPGGTTVLEPVRLQRGLFSYGSGLYTMNSKPGIAINLRSCLRHFFSQR